jgi:hypothetical protein
VNKETLSDIKLEGQVESSWGGQDQRTISRTFHHSKTMASLVDIQYLFLIVSIFINFKILHKISQLLGYA